MTSVLILYNEPRPAGSGWHEADAGVLAEVEAVAAALTQVGIPHRRAAVRRLSDIPEQIAAGDERVVFNLVEALDGPVHDACFVPAVCRSLGREPTGNDAAALTLCLDKGQAKAALTAAGVPTPPAVVVPLHATPAGTPDGTVVVKPVQADASEGIDEAAVVDGNVRSAVTAAVARVHREFHQPALVEAFIAGREINVSVTERDGHLEVLPLAEIDFSAFPPDKPQIVGYAAKWRPDSFEYHNTPRVIPAPLPQVVAQAVRRHAQAAWHAAGCQDYARVDLRVDDAGNPLVLEINPNPDIAPDAGFAAALAAAAIPYEEFVRAMVDNAERRWQARRPATAATAVTSPDAGDVTVRWSRPADREAILAALAATLAFRADELAIAREVLDDALRDGPAGDYQSYTAEHDGRVAGWICFGPTPCTVGTFDIYWIAVDPAAQGHGIGTALMALAESEIRAAGGRLAVAETSGRPSYAPTRRFYTGLGYHEAAIIADFYGPADDQVIFTKKLQPVSV